MTLSLLFSVLLQTDVFESLIPTVIVFNLLYSQVLSSCLIPTQQDRDEIDTQLFRHTFLEAGGLKSVINVHQRNALPSDVDLTIRQDCYAIALTLARWVSAIGPL